MEEKSFTPPTSCHICGHSEFKFVGYQWLPIATIVRLGGTPKYVDPDKPDRAAVELYICLGCGNSVAQL